MHKRALLAAAALLVLLLMAGGAAASQWNAAQPTSQQTTVTHQGYLTRNGSPYTGACDMRFGLFDALSGGSRVGSALDRAGVAVTNGLFVVQLDFAAYAFTGGDRYLETAVNCGEASFTTLSPRQALTPSPYAIHAVSAGELVREFTAAPGASIGAGDPVSLDRDGYLVPGFGFGPEARLANPRQHIQDVAALSPGSLAAAYSDPDGLAGVVLGTVSGNRVDFGAATPLNTATPPYLSPLYLVTLSPDRFLLVYVAYDDQGGNAPSAVVGAIAGGNVIFGPVTPLPGFPQSMAVLSPTRVVLVWNDQDQGVGVAAVASVSGDAITVGPSAAYSGGQAGITAVSTMGETRLVIAYEGHDFPDCEERSCALVMVGTLSGDSIVFGPRLVFASGTYAGAGTFIRAVGLLAVAGLGDSRFAVGYSVPARSNRGVVQMGSLVDGAVVMGPSAVLEEEDIKSLRLIGLSPDELAAVYTSQLPALYPYSYSEAGHAVFLAAAGDVLGISPEVFVFPAGFLRSVKPLSASQHLLLFTGPDNAERVLVGPNGYPVLLGIAQRSGGGGESLPVVVSGVSNAHSDLIPGRAYYVTPSGALTTVPNPNLAGVAVSSSELLLKAGEK